MCVHSSRKHSSRKARQKGFDENKRSKSSSPSKTTPSPGGMGCYETIRIKASVRTQSYDVEVYLDEQRAARRGRLPRSTLVLRPVPENGGSDPLSAWCSGPWGRSSTNLGFTGRRRYTGRHTLADLSIGRPIEWMDRQGRRLRCFRHLPRSLSRPIGLDGRRARRDSPLP